MSVPSVTPDTPEIKVLDFGAINQLHDLQANFVRFMNQSCAFYDFHITEGPYTPYVVFDSTGRCHLILGDTTFTWIDLKSPDIGKIRSLMEKLRNTMESKDLHATFIKEQLASIGIYGNKFTINKTKNAIIKTIITYEQNKKTQNEYIDKKTSTTSIDYEGFTQEQGDLLNKIYFSTNPRARKEYFSKDIHSNKQKLNEKGRMYYTKLLHDLFAHFENTKNIGKGRETILFPENTFSAIRDDIKKNNMLLPNEITKLLIYLLKPYSDEQIKIIANGANNSETIKDKAKLMKKMLINICYEALYDEQYYNYYQIQDIFADWNKDSSKKKSYTQRSIKSLGSLANKGLRRQQINDLVRSRTYLQDDKLMGDKQEKIITKNFSGAIEEFQQAAKDKGYTVLVDEIEVVSKFPKKRNNDNDDDSDDIFINQQTIDSIQIKLSKFIDTKEEEEHTDGTPLTGGPSTKITTKKISSSYLSKEENEILDTVFSNENKKGGGNTGYADIKIKMKYRLKNTETSEIIENTGGFEHMIVNYSTKNEGGLADHHIILDPKKYISQICRTNVNIGLDVFSEQVTGGLTNLVTKMSRRKKWLKEKSDNRPNDRPPRDFVKNQFEIRNKIPDELLPESLKKTNLLYSDLDSDFEKKHAVEKAIERYLLQLMFKEGTLVRFCYKGDLKSMNELGTLMNYTLDEGEKHSYHHKKGDKTYFENAMSSEETERKYYRFIGGGIGNLKDQLRKCTIPLDSYIGLPNEDGTVLRMKTSRVIGILNEHTVVNKD